MLLEKANIKVSAMKSIYDMKKDELQVLCGRLKLLDKQKYFTDNLIIVKVKKKRGRIKMSKNYEYEENITVEENIYSIKFKPSEKDKNMTVVTAITKMEDQVMEMVDSGTAFLFINHTEDENAEFKVNYFKAQDRYEVEDEDELLVALTRELTDDFKEALKEGILEISWMQV